MNLFEQLKVWINDENHKCNCNKYSESNDYHYHLVNCPKGMWLWMLYSNGKDN